MKKKCPGDPAGNLIQLTYPDGKVVTYKYDQNNRLTTVTDWAGRITTYSYDDNGRLVTTAFPNQTQETRTYEASGKLTGIQDLDQSGNVIYGCTCQIDAAGRVTSAALTPAPTGFSVPTATMSFDADNRLTQFDGMTVSFDSDGNMTNGPSVRIQVPTIYSYDARNRLWASGRVGYYYNPDGRRTTLTDYTNNINGVATNFVIDPSGHLDRTLVRSKGGTLTYYVYGLDLIGQEQNGVYQDYQWVAASPTCRIPYAP
jgi:YD repeat-containing protein